MKPGEVHFQCAKCEKYVTCAPMPVESQIEEGVFWAYCTRCFMESLSGMLRDYPNPQMAAQKVKSILFVLADRIKMLDVKELKTNNGKIDLVEGFDDGTSTQKPTQA